MKTRVSRGLAALLISCVAMPTFAASVYLELDPASAPVIEGDSFQVNLYLDAADTVVPNPSGGEYPGSVQGAVRIEFNSTLAAYQGFSNNVSSGNSCTVMGVDFCVDNITTPGTSNRITIEFSNALFADSSAPPVLIGAFAFNSVAATGGGPFGISLLDGWALADGTPFGTSFANINPSNQTFTPGFTGTSVAIAAAPIPVPAAAWLFMSGLGLLSLRRRTRNV